MREDEIAATMGHVTAALQNRDRITAISVITKLIASKAELDGRWNSIIQLLLATGELSLAISASRLWAEQRLCDDSSMFRHATVLAQAGRLHDAREAIDQLSTESPSRLENHFFRGTLALNGGRMADARRHLSEAAHLNPMSGQCLQLLASCVDLHDDNDVASRIQKAGSDLTKIFPDEHIHIHYAIGKLHKDRQDPKQAMEAFAKGAAIAEKLAGYSVELDRIDADTATAGWTREVIDMLGQSGAPSASRRPILVTGLARSGTTLVEQILSSSQDISGGDELSKFQLLRDQLGSFAAPDVIRVAEAKGLATLAEQYLHWATERFGSEGRFVDKSLDASRYLGAFACLFPDAPIVWVRRNPLDCALSCFTTFFMNSIPWSWRLEHIAEHFKLEDELHRHWVSVLGNRLLTVQYEELVISTEEIVKKLAAHCEVKFEHQMMRHHEVPGTVATASAAQVRRPVYQDAVGAAEPYRSQLKPFLDAYGPA